MKLYKIEIICTEDFADKGFEVLEHITETLENIYGDAEWIGFGGYVEDKENNNDKKDV